MSSVGCLFPTSTLPSFNITSAGWVTCPYCIPLYSLVSSCLEGSSATRGYAEAENDKLKINLSQAKIDSVTSETVSMNRPRWRMTIRAGWGSFWWNKSFKSHHRYKEDMMRVVRRVHVDQPRPTPTLFCDFCLELFRSRLCICSNHCQRHRAQGGKERAERMKIPMLDAKSAGDVYVFSLNSLSLSIQFTRRV